VGLPEVSRWLTRAKSNPSARLRLFCFPYAGGGASIFSSWVEHLPPEVELCPIQLPGRESRYSEPAFVNLSCLVQCLIPVLQPFTEIPFVFFGHSMGALIGFELARECRREGQQGPVHLMISACRAPQLPDPHPLISQESDSAFIDHLQQFGGMTEAVLEDSDLMDVLLPVLRADFAMYEAYSYSFEDPLECSISVFGGVEDQRVSQEELSAWQFQTSRSFELHKFPGQHFYINSSQLSFLNSLSQELIKLI
jgi:surfactin synthase thioesterase subunit